MNSDTPRTDAEQEHAANIALWISTGKHGYTEQDAIVVPTVLARELERENARLWEQLHKLSKRKLETLVVNDGPSLGGHKV